MKEKLKMNIKNLFRITYDFISFLFALTTATISVVLVILGISMLLAR